MMSRSEAGFTLIETLLSLALGAVVAAVVLVSVRTGLSMAKRFAVTDAEDSALSAVAELLTGDVQHVIGIPVTAGGELLAGSPQSFRFAMLARPLDDGTEGAPAIVVYRIALGTVSEVIRSETGLGEGATTSASVWQSASHLRFMFLDARNRWRDYWSIPGQLPRAIGIGVDTGSNSSPQIAATFMPVLPLSCAAGGAALAACRTEATP